MRTIQFLTGMAVLALTKASDLVPQNLPSDDPVPQTPTYYNDEEEK